MTSGFAAFSGNTCSDSLAVSQVTRKSVDAGRLSSVRGGTYVDVTSRLKLFTLLFCFLSEILAAEGYRELEFPYFVVPVDVCNQAETVIYNLRAEGDSLTFDILKSDDNIYRKGSRLVLLRAITEPGAEMTVDMSVTSSGYKSDNYSQSRLSLRIKADDRYCEKNDDSNWTLPVVILSSLLVFASTGSAVCLILLLRRRDRSNPV
ncbi:hypothetical protein HDE_11131 [Halotydeus destructor]|nr:hypothetical protein HDE_11131 [Halotydeus destructor]